MQHNQAQSTVDSLLQAHTAAAKQVQVLSKSAGRYWIHQQSCAVLASTYKQALQKLTNMLTLPLLSYHLNAHQLQLRVQPALDMLLYAILQGMHFLETSCRPSPADPAKSYPVTRHHTSSTSSLATSSTSASAGEDFFPSSEIYAIADDMKSWLLRVLLKGCATDAIDVHLHDFLIAFSAVCAVIEDLNAREYMQERGRVTDQAPSPDSFWREENKPNLLLVSGHNLDYAKHTDDNVLNSLLESAMNLRGYRNDVDTKQQQITTITMAADVDATQAAAFVKEKIRCARQAMHQRIDPGFLDQPLPDIKKLEVDNRPMFSVHTTSVHKVEWLGRHFALKVYYMKADDMCGHMEESSEDIIREGSTEQKIQVRLNHPNVVHAVALYKREQEYGILMELMDENLKSFLQKHRLSLRLQEKVSIMLQIAKGMAYVHGRGVIHRDLKPSNVFVRSFMGPQASKIQQLAKYIEVKVADFGESNIVSRSLDSSSFTTKRIGTTVYRAPEVLNDSTDSSNYKRSADVYSFAMTCFELLAEKEPFHEVKLEKRKTLQASVIKGERPDLASIRDDACPPYLKHCLNTWWDHEPQTRHSFTHICCILRHLYVCLAGCRSDTQPITQFPFLAWPYWRWRTAQDMAQERLHELDIRRANEDWKSKGYWSESTRVNEIPYELHVMKWAIKKAGAAEYEPEEGIEPANGNSSISSTPGQTWESINSIYDMGEPSSLKQQSSRQRGESTISSSSEFVSRRRVPSIENTGVEVSPPANEISSSSSSTGGKSLGQKLKELCCFTPARSIMPSNHEAFHDDVTRRI